MNLIRLSPLSVILVFALSSSVTAQRIAEPPNTSSTSLNEALAQFQRGEVEASLASFQALREAGEQEPAELARIERYLGILYASLGSDERALRAFSRSLAIDPAQSTPDEIGPEQQASFQAAQQARAGAGLDVPVTRAETAYRVRIVGAPDEWVARLELSYGGRSEEAQGDVIELEPSAAEWLGERLVVRVVARDAFGNVILRRRVELERESQVTSRRGLVIGVVLASLALVAGGIVTALLLRGRDDGFEEGGSVTWELGRP